VLSGHRNTTAQVSTFIPSWLAKVYAQTKSTVCLSWRYPRYYSR